MIAPVSSTGLVPLQPTATSVSTTSTKNLQQSSTTSYSSQVFSQDGFTDAGLAFLALLALIQDDNETYKLDLYPKATLLAIALNLADNSVATDVSMSSLSQLSFSQTNSSVEVANNYTSNGSTASNMQRGVLYNATM